MSEAATPAAPAEAAPASESAAAPVAQISAAEATAIAVAAMSAADIPPDAPDAPAAPAKKSSAAGDESFTRRLATVSTQAREARASAKAEATARAAAEAKATALEQRLAAASSEATTLGELKAHFAKGGDPLKALSALGVTWKDVVESVATFEEAGDTESARAAKAELAEIASAAKMARDAVEALRKERDDERKAAVDAQRLAQEKSDSDGAVAFVSSLITAESFPALSVIDGAASAALADVQEALRAVGKTQADSTEEAVALVRLALQNREDYHAEQAEKVAAARKLKPKPTDRAQQSAAAAEAAAQSKRTPGARTITARAQGASPPAAQPTKLPSDQAKARAIAAARGLPS